MGKQKYRFNPETLSFEVVKKEPKGLIIKAALYFGTVVTLFFIFVIFFGSYINSPLVNTLREKNRKLLSQYQQMDGKLKKIEGALTEIQKRDDDIYRVIFEADPVPSSMRKAGFGGTDLYSGIENIEESDFIAKTAKRLDVISKQAYVQACSYQEVLSMALNKEKMLASVPAIMPISSSDLSMISSGFGMRLHPIYKTYQFHYGLDFVAVSGTKVYCTGDGVVKDVINDRWGHGKHVVVSHGFGYETLYGHLSQFKVVPGQVVKRGDVVGLVGSTGTSTAPHLHYEVAKDDKKVDPKYYFYKDLSPAQFDEITARTANKIQSFD